MFKLRGWVLAFIIFMGSAVFAVENILIIPDNIVAKKSIQAVIYEDCAEFFAGEVINTLNNTRFIKAPNITYVREKIKSNVRLTQSTASAMKEFREGYNINYLNVKKLAQTFGVKKVMLITSSIDSKNYMLRRTVWDFMNIPGAAVIDPALKISTYAVLIDVNKDATIWSNTYYKTISVVETRMVPVDYVQNTQQLEKIRDYSRSLAPNIAKNIQLCVLPPSITSNKDNLIEDGFSVYDNVLTKKYRSYKKNTSVLYNEAKDNINEKKEIHAEKRAERRAQREAEKARRAEYEKTLPPKETLKQKLDKKVQVAKENRQKQKVERADAKIKEKLNKEKIKTELKLKKEQQKQKIKEMKSLTTEQYYHRNMTEINAIPMKNGETTPKTNSEPSLSDIMKNEAPEYIRVKPKLRDSFNNLETINDL